MPTFGPRSTPNGRPLADDVADLTRQQWATPSAVHPNGTSTRCWLTCCRAPR